MNPYLIFAVGAVAGAIFGLIIAALLGMAGHADHQEDLREALAKTIFNKGYSLMYTQQDIEKLFKAKKTMEAIRPNFTRFMKFLDEKREKGIVPKKTGRVPTLQEIERFGYERLLTKQFKPEQKQEDNAKDNP